MQRMPLCKQKRSCPVKKLVAYCIEGVQAKIQKTERKIEDYQTGKKTPKRIALAICLEGLRDRLHKLKEIRSSSFKTSGNRHHSSCYFWGKEILFMNG